MTEQGLAASPEPEPEPVSPPEQAWHSIVTAVLRDATGERILIEQADPAPAASESRAPAGPNDPERAALPHIRIEDYQWVAESEAVVAGFATRLGFRPWILRQMRFEEAAEGASERGAAKAQPTKRVLLTVVFEAPPADWTPPAGFRWRDRDGAPLADPSEEGLLEILRREHAHGQPPDRRPWALDGGDWRARAVAWTDHVLAQAGRTRTGPVDQQRTWGISCVLHAPTDQGRVYFKAAARLPLFVLEGPFVDWLARVAPEHSPEILDAHEREGWLLTADFGASMRPGQDPVTVDAQLRDALRTYGVLQRRLSAHVDAMRAVGAHARGLDWLAAEIDPLLADPMVEQSVAPEALARLRGHAPHLRALCAELDSLGIPDSLLHGDLHPGNMTMADDRLLFFDWTDAAIGHPFLDPFVATSTSRPERTAAIRAGYLEAWSGVAPDAALERAWTLARPLTMLYQATSYRHLLAGLEPMARPGLDGGLSGWLAMLAEYEQET